MFILFYFLFVYLTQEKKMSSKVIDIRAHPNTKVIDIDAKVIEIKGRQCAGCQSEDTKWKFYCMKWLCSECATSPLFKTICRSQAMLKYNLTFEQLIKGYEQGYIQNLFTVRNPYTAHRKISPMKLYFEREIQMFAYRLKNGLIELE